MKKFASVIVLVVLLSSCLVGPKYTRPEIDSPKNWRESNKFITSEDSIINLKWFELFNDTVLNALIDSALLHNVNLTNAVIRMEQANAAYGIAKAEMLPSIGYQAIGKVNKPSPHSFNMVGTASWEIDFWGKLRHSKRATYNQILASEEGIKAITAMLVSQVAALYFQIGDLDHRLVIAEQTIESRTKYLNLIDARFRGGDVAELDKLQADQQLSIAKATASSVKRQLNATERSLNILLGQKPQTISRGFKNTDENEFPLIPQGLPSTLLEQRPDIKQAEYILISETERIGVTQAMRFPSISLTGFFGLASPELSSLISDQSYAGSAAATILGPIFNFGSNKRRVDIQRSEAQIAANNYVNTYIAALGEVESSLVSVQTFSDEYEARKNQAQSAAKSLMLSRERYNNGYTDYLEVLIAENALFDSELQASIVKAQQLTSYVQLYKSLGGGW
jgi:multidrug efflux system outer membrane protein